MDGASSAIMPAETFLRNMRALWRSDPALALRVDAVDENERPVLEPTRSGDWTVRAAASDGTTVYLHSRHDPRTEARRFADAVPLEDKFCFVVAGAGLGYHLRALADRLRGDFLILCLEPVVEVLAAALCCTDLADLIAGGRMFFLTDDDKRRLHQILQPHSTLIMLGTQFVSHPPSARMAETALARIQAAIREFITFSRMTLMTLVGNSRITCKNIAMNLPALVTTPPIDGLRGRFAGHPAVVISAGPSLSRNIEQLGNLKGRAVLCAVQTALRPLLARDVVPDFVTCLDFHEMSQKFFENVGDLSEVHLVAEPKATWHVIDHYPGPVSLLDNAWARLLLGDDLAARDGLAAGATVAHLAFYLAVYLGCDPVIFVGQDLAFTGHVFYVPGVEIHRTWRSETNRFLPMEQKEWERIVRNRPILRRVTGSDGGELFTDELLFTYLEQFEKDIAAAPCRVINATEGGARIRGTEAMTLHDAQQRYCAAPIDPGRFAYRRQSRRRDRTRLPAAMAQVRMRLDELEEARRVCDELLTLLDELKGLTGDPGRFNRRLIRVDELRTRVYQESRAYKIINSATQLAELRRYSADRRLGAADTEDDAQRARRQIARDADFLSGVRDGAAEVSELLRQALARLEKAEECS